MSLGYFYEDNSQLLRIEKCHSLNFPMHLHMQAELVYVINGSTCLTIEAKRRVLGAGEAALVWPGSVHGYETCGESEHVIAIIDVALLGGYRDLLTNSHCPEPFLCRALVHSDVPHCLNTLMNEGDIAEPLRRAYLRVALGRLVNSLALEPRPRPGGHDALHSLLTYISAHIAEPLSLDSMAKALFLNKYTISKLFSERVGCNLNTYINALRVSMAENLMYDTQTDIVQIAERCGFESERTFYRAFRAQRCMTPGQFRKTLR